MGIVLLKYTSNYLCKFKQEAREINEQLKSTTNPCFRCDQKSMVIVECSHILISDLLNYLELPYRKMYYTQKPFHFSLPLLS
jgi:hypothetical protein